MSEKTVEVIFKCPVHGIRERSQIIRFSKMDREGTVIGQSFTCKECNRELEMI